MNNRIIVTSVLYRVNAEYSEFSRIASLSTILEKVEKSPQTPDFLIFPAGFLKFYNEEDKTRLISRVQIEIKNKNTLVCLGIDSVDGQYQLGILLSQGGIVAMGRQFFPVEGLPIRDYLIQEEGHSRIFTLRNKRFYIAVCNDIKGITALHLPQPQPIVDVVVNLVHGFYRPGNRGASTSYFARAMANSAQKWDCSVIGSAVFFDRDIPNNWPAGIKLRSPIQDIRSWQYKNNSLPLINVTQDAFGELKTYKL